MDNESSAPNNIMDNDEALECAYDIFLELASDNLEPADIALFNLQFEECGAAEIAPIELEKWQEYFDFELDTEKFAEVIIGLLNKQEEFATIFAQMAICKDRSSKICHILWRE